uniref:NADH-ubiquinone oxidoreductase chain 4L n=1 Tax=Bullacta caurina TaxID=2510888 RepID=A0A4D6BLE0_9GAST|nr:NADH dehydrogenase subunit 4L [Bullacta caurina]QBX88145.1 NADH dehydrogenase subunit 4L [Bullacta caurina]
MMKLSLMGIGFASLSFALYQTHVLSLLISLEALMLSLLFFTFSFLSCYTVSLFWFLVVLTFAACEAALGLSLLVSMLRLRGNDYITTMSSNMFFAI